MTVTCMQASLLLGTHLKTPRSSTSLTSPFKGCRYFTVPHPNLGQYLVLLGNFKAEKHLKPRFPPDAMDFIFHQRITSDRIYLSSSAA